MIGFDENHANTLLVENDMLTGFVEEPILGREAKLDTLLEVARYLQLPLAETIAVGDGANDLAMIGRAGLGRRLSRQARGGRGRRMCASTMATSPRSCICRAIGGTSSWRTAINNPFVPAKAGTQNHKHWRPRFRGGERMT